MLSWFPDRALAWAVVGVRAVRDLYAAQIFAGALHVAVAPTWIFYLVDLPGALLSSLALVLMGCVRDSRRALLTMLALMLSSVALMLLATLLFQLHVLGGLAWQLLFGAGFYVTYGLIGAPRTSDRMCLLLAETGRAHVTGLAHMPLGLHT
jgi:hypothetical protein